MVLPNDYILWFGSHSKKRLLSVKLFLSLLRDFLFKIDMRGNPLTVKGLPFQILSFHCHGISFGLEMKSCIVRRKCNLEDKRKKIVWCNLMRNVHEPNFDKFEY